MERETIQKLLDEMAILWVYSEDLPMSIKYKIQKKITELQKALEYHISR